MSAEAASVRSRDRVAMSHLPPALLEELRSFLLASGLVSHPWLDGVFGALPAPYRAELEVVPAPAVRLEQALRKLNEDGPLADGRLPLAIVLTRFTLEPLQALVDRARNLLDALGPAATAAAASITVSVTLQDALRDVWMTGAELFADREELRERLDDLARDDGPTAVIVNGGVKVGKSHTRKLLAHAALKTRAFRLAWVEIERAQAASFTADWLIEELVHSVVPGATGLPPRREPEARWLGDLASWAFEQLTHAGTDVPMWIVIDGSNLPAVKDEVRSVVERLAIRAATPTGRLKVRMILIDCDTLRIHRTGCHAEEQQLLHLTTADAERCLQQLAPAQFASIWPKVQAALASSPALTTLMISAVVREAIRS